MEFFNIAKNVRAIALEDLRSCYTEKGILASHVNFSDYWARDSFWASLGMLETGNPGEIAQTRKTLELFMKYQRADGKIPRKITLDYNGLKYLGIKIKRKNPRPIFTSPIKSFFATDDNLLFIISFAKFVEKTNDIEFAKTHFEKVRRAVLFHRRKNIIRKNLVFENGLANWMDTIFKRGFVLYTNCLWLEAVRRFEILCNKLNMDCDGKNIPASQSILKAIQKSFWLDRENFFADSVSGVKPQKYFDLAGNVLTVLFEIADKDQSENILSKIERIKNDHSLHPINAPLYPFWKVNPLTYLFGISRYHNGISWSWLEALVIAVKCKLEKRAEAEKNFLDLSSVIMKNGHIHETYFLDGRPFDHLLWKSAVPFAWGAGLFLWAEKLINSEKA